VLWAQEDVKRCDSVKRILKLAKGWEEARDHVLKVGQGGWAVQGADQWAGPPGAALGGAGLGIPYRPLARAQVVFVNLACPLSDATPCRQCRQTTGCALSSLTTPSARDCCLAARAPAPCWTPPWVSASVACVACVQTLPNARFS
jgi:hypothetical protein